MHNLFCTAFLCYVHLTFMCFIRYNSIHKFESIGNQPRSDFQQDVVRQMCQQEFSGTWPRQRAVTMLNRGTYMVCIVYRHKKEAKKYCDLTLEN